MDKLLPLINFFKVNRFWLTCSLLAAAMIGVWFMATGELTTAMNSARSGIEQKVSAANGIISTTAVDVDESIVAHPNDSTIKGMEAELEKGTQSVLDAWKLRYDGQKELMTWPEEVTRSKQFVDYFSQFRPFETFPETVKGQTMRELLQVYHQQIPGRMDAICDIIGTKWTFSDKEAEENKKAQDESGAGDRGRGGGERGRGDPGGRGGQPPDMTRPPRGGGGDDRTRGAKRTNTDGGDISDVVQWDETNQELWYNKLTNFRGFDDNELKWNLPTPLQIYTLQQDLWLLEAIFNIVKTVNGEADANDLAKVKRIDHVVFGREARAQLGEIREPQQGLVAQQAKTGAAGGRSAGMQGDKAAAGRRMMERNQRMAQGGDDPFAAVVDPHNSPFHGRYVDENFEPIKAEDVRNVLRGTDLPDKYLELVVAKRVPVRIAVRMDERYIPEFLTACSKSAFAFEVNQVRINRHIPGDGIVRVGGAMGKTGGGSGRDDRPDRGATIGAGGGAGGAGLVDDEPPKKGGGGEGEVDVEVRTNFDVDVEFYGIVKIYNPVNRALLTGEKEPVAEQPADAQPAPTTRP